TSSEPTKENAKRKLKNYKLKHSRLLTCYSALLYLLAIFRCQNTVSPDNVVQMTRLTPTQRLEWLLEQKELAGAHAAVQKLLDQYEAFLGTTNAPEEELIEKFLNTDVTREHMKRANVLGQSVFDALNIIGNGSILHRIIVV